MSCCLDGGEIWQWLVSVSVVASRYIFGIFAEL